MVELGSRSKMYFLLEHVITDPAFAFVNQCKLQKINHKNNGKKWKKWKNLIKHEWIKKVNSSS